MKASGLDMQKSQCTKLHKVFNTRDSRNIDTQHRNLTKLRIQHYLYNQCIELFRISARL